MSLFSHLKRARNEEVSIFQDAFHPNYDFQSPVLFIWFQFISLTNYAMSILIGIAILRRTSVQYGHRALLTSESSLYSQSCAGLYMSLQCSGMVCYRPQNTRPQSLVTSS
ncbi:hypothetical protein BDR06DRAFT_344469 [Suillus hirtellus]|nr:hypothetical protein BDR06DRAFT_344469 [Suillus hirtellus]